MDALNRLAVRGVALPDLADLFAQSPIHCLESLQQGGGDWATYAQAERSYSHF